MSSIPNVTRRAWQSILDKLFPLWRKQPRQEQGRGDPLEIRWKGHGSLERLEPPDARRLLFNELIIKKVPGSEMDRFGEPNQLTNN